MGIILFPILNSSEDFYFFTLWAVELIFLELFVCGEFLSLVAST